MARRMVELWNSNGELLLRVFKDAKAATKETGFDHGDILYACYHNEIYKGFLWKFRSVDT